MAVPARTVLENGPRTRPCPHKTKYIRSPRPEVRNVPTPTLMPPADRPESNAAHTVAFPPRLGQGPRLAQVSLRAMECALSPDHHLQARRLGSPATI